MESKKLNIAYIDATCILAVTSLMSIIIACDSSLESDNANNNDESL